jgi:hypothetical protein
MVVRARAPASWMNDAHWGVGYRHQRECHEGNCGGNSEEENMGWGGQP